MKKISLLIGLALTCSNAIAAGYAGIGVGKTDYDAGATFDDPIGFEIYVGNEFNKNLSIEASYIDFGESSDGIPPEWRINADSLAFGVLGKAPVSESVELFAKIGLHFWDAEFTEDGFGVLNENDGQDIFWGFGATLKVNKRFSLGARYTSYDFDGDDVTRFSVNAQIGF